MKALVINLARETTRLAFQRQQADRLGLDLEVVAAVQADALSPPADDPCWTRWQRPLRDVEKAALLSHRAVWARVIALDAPALVLEDDAWLMPGAAAFATTSTSRKNFRNSRSDISPAAIAKFLCRAFPLPDANP